MIYFILVIVVLPQIALLLLYTPNTQQAITQWGMARLSEHIGTDVRLEKIRIRFPLRIEMQGVRFGELLSVGKIEMNIRLLPLREETIAVNELNVDDISFNSDSLTQSTALDIIAKTFKAKNLAYQWEERKAYIQSFQLADGYARITQRAKLTQEDSTSPGLPFSLYVEEVNFLRIKADYTTPQMNMKASAEDITLQEFKVDPTLQIALQQSKIEDCTLILEPINKRPWTFTELNVITEDILYNTEILEGEISHLSFNAPDNTSLRDGAIAFAWKDGEISAPNFRLHTPHSTLQGHLHKLDYSTKNPTFNADFDVYLGYTDALSLMKSYSSLPSNLIELYPTETLHLSVMANGSLEQLQIRQCHLSLPTALDIHLNGSLFHAAHPKQSEAQIRWKGKTYNLDFIQALVETEDFVIPSYITTQGTLLYTPDTIYAQCSLNLQEGMAALKASYRPIDQAYTLNIKADSLNLKQIFPREELGQVSLQADLSGKGVDYKLEGFNAYGKLHFKALQWKSHTFSNASAQMAIADNSLHVQAWCQDSLMQWNLTTHASIKKNGLYAELEASIDELNLQAMQIMKSNLHPTFQCHATLSIDSAQTYTLCGELNNIALSTPEGNIRPRPLSLKAQLSNNAIMLDLKAGGITSPNLNIGDISLTAHYAAGRLRTQLHSVNFVWRTPQMTLQGCASGTLLSDSTFTLNNLLGELNLTDTYCSIPAYNLKLRATDTLSIPLEHGILTLSDLPIYTYGEQPLVLNGKVSLFEGSPTLQLQLSAQDVNLLQPQVTNESILYGKAFISGNIELYGQPNDLAINGSLQLLPRTSIHYIYKDAILTASNQMESVVTFVSLRDDSTSIVSPKKKFTANNLTINLHLAIAPTAELEVSLGQSKQNHIALQGGGTLNLQYSHEDGLLLAGRYSIENGDLTMNIPLLHVSHMRILPGSTLTWSGNPQNPLLNISAEERIRASVTLDGSPESVLFVTGISLTDTMEKLEVQFTLSAPENASMQNTLATLSADERSKLVVALLTTGLYLGEGGTGNLMNTALMSLLQSQLDDISHNTFRTVDVSFGIDPLFDGVSGVSTRTDYTFNLAKRLWNDRIRISIGGSITSTNQYLKSDGVIDNISIEWRITPIGSQYLRFFYDKHYESILEGEIRETGIGYAYRIQF